MGPTISILRRIRKPAGGFGQVAAAQRGTLQEIFGCGTAAVISPVGELGYRDVASLIGTGVPIRGEAAEG